MDRIGLQRLAQERLSRRRFLVATGALAGLTIVGALPGEVEAAPRFPADPFKLGVASGDPLPDGVVLWTRLAPEPLAPDGLGGLRGRKSYRVGWRIATDEGMRTVVQAGTVRATEELGYSVHVDVRGLQPGTVYYYQFNAGRELSPVGRTRTAPPPGAPVNRLRFAFVSCQDYQNGFYAAYGAMVRQDPDLDFVVHLGDYIYEYGPESTAVPGRQHDGPEVDSLASYRNRHALYRSDSNLRAAHEAFAFIVTTDDHEVENNYANLIREEEATPPTDFVRRRANAYQAYYEHMPLRRSSLPQGPNQLLYRRLTYGHLAEFSILDTRQYRTDQPCGDGIKERCAAALSEAQTMTGPEQERWLLDGLAASGARWNVIGQQTMLAEFDFIAAPTAELFNMDQWDGYVAARNRLLGFLNQRRPSNPIVITGDIHSAWAHDLKTDFADPASPTVGVEFVGTSITSSFPDPFVPIVQAALTDNPHTRFFDGLNRGYTRCDVTPARWRTDFQIVPKTRGLGQVTVDGTPATTLASFVVEDGVPGTRPA